MWGHCRNKLSPAGAAHCGSRYWRERRGTCEPHTMGPRWCPSGTAHTQPKVWAESGPQLGPLWAQSNGQTEKLNRELEKGLRCLVYSCPSFWSKNLIWVDYAHNTLPCSASGLTPFQCASGYQPPLFPELEAEVVVPSAQALIHWCCRIWNWARLQLIRAAARNKRAVDQQWIPAPSYQPGQRLWLSAQDLPLRVESYKLAPRFTGPFPISRVVNPAAVHLKLPRTWKIHPTFHVSRVKLVKDKDLWFPPSDPPDHRWGPCQAVPARAQNRRAASGQDQGKTEDLWQATGEAALQCDQGAGQRTEVAQEDDQEAGQTAEVTLEGDQGTGQMAEVTGEGNQMGGAPLEVGLQIGSEGGTPPKARQGVGGKGGTPLEADLEVGLQAGGNGGVPLVIGLQAGGEDRAPRGAGSEGGTPRRAGPIRGLAVKLGARKSRRHQKTQP
eukprot:superscaffoldBa00004994_g19761